MIGFDWQGKEQLKGDIVGTKKWIGTSGELDTIAHRFAVWLRCACLLSAIVSETDLWMVMSSKGIP